MKFCSNCGGVISRRVPANDDRERHVCDSCETVHYQNSRIVVGCLPVYGESVLLCRRAIHPRRDYWTLPAGLMENGETTLEGARRETWEEARALVEDEASPADCDRECSQHLRRLHHWGTHRCWCGGYGIQTAIQSTNA